MDGGTRSSGTAGGIFLALGVMGGLVAGAQFGEPVIGLLAGFVGGVLLAVLFWLARR